MIPFSLRRRIALALLLLLTALSLLLWNAGDRLLYNTRFTTGWLLWTLMVLLAAFNVRKKLPYLPLLSNSTWLQIHIYLGYFTLVIFTLHIDLRAPDGYMELGLALLYGLAIISGLIGLALSRIVPGRLRIRGEAVIFERHPALLNQLRQELEAQALVRGQGATIADFYARRLIAFFARPRHLVWHLLQSNRPLVTLLNEFTAQERFLDANGKKQHAAIVQLIRQKATLDYHYAHQAALKYWLFLHIPLSYSLLLLGLVHGALAHAYRGGI
ncbi:MAG: hypothetical protein GKR89_28280 [Candidatus Latescibacteria bacterium]|nr:hypothetical protein [Candidatus Latescibacterota bacterium]